MSRKKIIRPVAKWKVLLGLLGALAALYGVGTCRVRLGKLCLVLRAHFLRAVFGILCLLFLRVYTGTARVKKLLDGLIRQKTHDDKKDDNIYDVHYKIHRDLCKIKSAHLVCASL